MHDQLYRQFLMRKKQKLSAKHIQNNEKSKRRSILKKFFEFKDDDLVSLESSVPILKNLSIIKHIDNVDHIVSIMQAKRSANNQIVKNQQLLQCRLIYFLWAVIEHETIEMREFKDIVMLLLSNQNRLELMRDRFGDKDGIQELIQCWDQIVQSQSSFLSVSINKSYNEIQDISIIRSKNEIKNDLNKENCSYFQQTLQKSNSILSRSRSKGKIRSKNQPIDKSFHKKQERQYLNASRSLEKQVSKKSGQFSIASSGNATKKINFYSNYESLTVEQEKTLVSRLYRTDKYKQRQELKKIYEQERIKAELNECSFKPKVGDRSRAMSREKIATKQVRGYEKAVQRMKSGYKKTKQFKEDLEYRIWRESNQSKQVHVDPPTFLNRKKEAAHELFQIVFTIGRHNIRIKVKESDKISDIVNNMGQIYTLKEENKAEIRRIIEQQVSNYYQANSRLNTDPQEVQ